MKKFFILLLAIATLIWNAPAFALGTTTLSAAAASDKYVWDPIEGAVVAMKEITLTWVGDVSAGTIPDTVINATTYGLLSWFLYSAETAPGSPAPDPNYDWVINDDKTLDIAGGLLLNRHTTAPELVGLGSASFGYPVIRGNITAVMSNNTIASAQGTLILIFFPSHE